MSLLDRTDSLSVGRGWSSIQTHRTEHGNYLEGMVFTPHGIVAVYSQEDATTFRTVVDGQLYHMGERRGRTARGLAILAQRWMREIYPESDR